MERSRSGNGGHIWIFFAEPVSATLASRLGAHLLTETMERNPDIGFESYDRLFPSLDSLSAGGFGNLIALPLARGPRKRGNSLFWTRDSSLGQINGRFSRRFAACPRQRLR